MPLYEYHCDACGRRFELIRKFSDPPLEKCPTCGGLVHKLMSSPAFQFKGSGWYITDYAKKDQAGSRSDDGQSETTSKDKDKDAGGKGGETSGQAEKKDSKTESKTGSGGDSAAAPAPGSTSSSSPSGDSKKD